MNVGTKRFRICCKLSFAMSCCTPSCPNFLNPRGDLSHQTVFRNCLPDFVLRIQHMQNDPLLILPLRNNSFSLRKRVRICNHYYNYYYYWYSALGPVGAETRVQSGNWYGSGTLHPGQVLRGGLPCNHMEEKFCFLDARVCFFARLVLFLKKKTLLVPAGR
jgi:hypothetical protein